MVVHEADLPGRQGRRLWVYLTLHRRGPVGRDELAEAIWGDDVPDAWDTTLNALAAGGNPAQAATIYAVCRREPRERAGMPPSSETDRVFREIAGNG